MRQRKRKTDGEKRDKESETETEKKSEREREKLAEVSRQGKTEGGNWREYETKFDAGTNRLTLT